MPDDKKSKAQSVRDYIEQHPKASPQEVADALDRQEVKVNARYVSQIKSRGKTMKQKSPTASPARSSGGVKGTPWTFPKHPLEEAIRVPKQIEEKNAGNPMPASVLAKAVGFRKSNDWRFLDLLRSANQYGLVSGAGANATVRMEKLGQDIVIPASPHDRQKAMLAAFNNVPDFKAVAKFYGDKKIPDDEFFLNTLTRQFQIPRDRVQTFAEVFVANLEYLRAFDMVQPEPKTDGVTPVEDENPTTERRVSKQPRVRAYLETCFVMMPFGNWFDKYYQDIYVPAIQESGFEPVRADELFSSGSVVEQIWEQIKKARVLLADLTDRNANVFYELGLAHAARKPVVFAAPKVEDVPFDLRHLRVIIYDIREPEWAVGLRRSVTDYLKTAAKQPEKSIPHPFRMDEEEPHQ
jgi:hypothetical protein